MFCHKVKILITTFCFLALTLGIAFCAEGDDQTDTASEVQKVISDADSHSSEISKPDRKVSAPPLKAGFKKSNQNVDQVQRELDDVINTNQGLQEDYLKRMEKIQAISTQAKIHQKILDSIRSQTPAKPSVVQQAVQQEKVRLIAEQARKNHELLKTLRSTQQRTSQ